MQWTLFAPLWLLAQIPYKVQCWLGKRLGRLATHLLPGRKAVAAVNLKLCFPELDEKQRNTLLQTHFEELGMMLTQTLKAFWGNTDNLEKTAAVTGLQYIKDSLRRGRGVLLVSGHFTALDMGGKILSRHIPLAGVYRPHKSEFMERRVLCARLRYAKTMFRRDQLRHIVRHLREGGVLWYAPDQDYRRGKSVFVPFFGHPAATITATHQLARLSGCAVHFFSVKRLDEAPWYSLSISPPMTDFPSHEAKRDTTRLNQQLEDMIRQAPAQYLWIHKRFKTQPQGNPCPY